MNDSSRTTTTTTERIILTENDDDPPERFVCPLTLQVMVYPMMTRQGHVFERQAIFDWLRRNDTHPLTRQPLGPRDLVMHHALRAEIRQWRYHHHRASTSSSNQCGSPTTLNNDDDDRTEEDVTETELSDFSEYDEDEDNDEYRMSRFLFVSAVQLDKYRRVQRSTFVDQVAGTATGDDISPSSADAPRRRHVRFWRGDRRRHHHPR